MNRSLAIDKLTERDIIIVNPGKQLEKAISEKFSSLDEFVEAMGRKRNAIYTYLHTEPYGSSTFRLKLPFVLNKSYDEIVTSIPQQINNYLEIIRKNIKQYDDEEDEKLFEKLLKLCDKYSLTTEKAIVYRLYGKHHFLANRKNTGIEYIRIAIEYAISEGKHTLLLSFYTDLIMYYYYQKQYKRGKLICHKSEGLIRKVLVDNEIFFEYYYRVGQIYNQTDYAKARKMFTKALEYETCKDDRYRALFCIAPSYKKEKNYDLAIEYYMKALEEIEYNDLKKSELYNNIASLYNSAGDKEKALYYNNLSFEFSPNDNSDNYGKLYIDNKILCNVTFLCSHYMHYSYNRYNKKV